MFYLNQNDMDELFREASENYQLDADAAFDWERIDRSLHEPGNENDNTEEKKKKRRPFAFWYLLFIPLGWLGHYAWTSYESNQAQKNISVNNQPAKKVTADATLPKQETKDESTAAVSSTSGDEKNKQGLTASSLNTANNKTFSLSNTAETSLTNSNKVSKDLQQKSITPLAEQITNNKNITVAEDDANALSNKNVLPNAVVDSFHNTAINNTQEKNKDNQQTNTASAKKTITVKTKQQGFYAGLLFAPDLTFIKFQRVPGIGTSFGLIGGYRINNRWSIETGILSDKKKYYTKGDYFDKTNVSYLSDKDLVSVDGNCEMIEVPINARYNFTTGKKNNWTASLGTSSYFMKEEYYNYSIKVNGLNEQHDHVYHSSSKNLFAVINLGAGYERSLGKSLTLRAEPYFKIPLSGVGTGNLSMSGAGINIGIIKSFHK